MFVFAPPACVQVSGDKELIAEWSRLASYEPHDRVYVVDIDGVTLWMELPLSPDSLRGEVEAATLAEAKGSLLEVWSPPHWQFTPARAPFRVAAELPDEKVGADANWRSGGKIVQNRPAGFRKPIWPSLL